MSSLYCVLILGKHEVSAQEIMEVTLELSDREQTGTSNELRLNNQPDDGAMVESTSNSTCMSRESNNIFRQSMN
jgi:hypothetical protein